MGRITSGSSTDSLRLNAAAFHYRYCLTSFTNPSTAPHRSIVDHKNRGRREQVRAGFDFITAEPSRHFYGPDDIYKPPTICHIVRCCDPTRKYREIDGF